MGYCFSYCYVFKFSMELDTAESLTGRGQCEV